MGLDPGQGQWVNQPFKNLLKINIPLWLWIKDVKERKTVYFLQWWLTLGLKSKYDTVFFFLVKFEKKLGIE